MATPTTHRRPTTPLRRLSASSLRSLSLSHSLSHPPSASEPPLSHLSHILAELSDSLSDLSSNFEQLDNVNATLDGWNEAFAGYIYGLRMNAYTADFEEAPTRSDFISLASRRPPTPPIEEPYGHHGREGSVTPTGGREHDAGNETTFVTQESEYSFMRHSPPPATKTGTKKKGALTKKQKAEQLAFADGIIQLLPIPFREQPTQRSCVETILPILQAHPNGIGLADIDVKMPTVQKHRINESLVALVRAKVVIKTGIKYRIDASKYS